MKLLRHLGVIGVVIYTGLLLQSQPAFAGLLLQSQPAIADDDCFWSVKFPSEYYVFYPDYAADYWQAVYALPAGTQLRLRGQFPHSRYMSLTVYDVAGRPIDGLADIAIHPDAGSTNPFVAGADRENDQRSYTVSIIPEAPPADPADREPNTVYQALEGVPNPIGILTYRIYLADSSQDVKGGVDLPDAELVLANGTAVPLPGACELLSGSSADLADLIRDVETLKLPLGDPSATDPLRWERFYNIPYSVQYYLDGTPFEGLRELTSPDNSGGFFSNLDNYYVFSHADLALGEMLIMHGHAPTFPATEAGQLTMATGQVRFWSLCTGDPATTRTFACLNDSDFLLDQQGNFTLVISPPSNRPMNATPECGVNWLPWGPSSFGLVPILRHMLPSPDFAQAISNVMPEDNAEEVMGEYLPKGTYWSKAEFEALGCPLTGTPSKTTVRDKDGAFTRGGYKRY